MMMLPTSLPEPSPADRDAAPQPAKPGLLDHIAKARAERLAEKRPTMTGVDAMTIVGGLFVAAFAVSWLNKPAAPVPARPTPAPPSHAIVVDRVRGCNDMDGCVTFLKGMRLIIEGHVSGSYLARRLPSEPAYWIPDRYLEPERTS